MTGPLNMNNFPINNVAAGDTPGSVATLAQAMPLGAVIDFAGATAPAGWMFCTGQAISRTTFATLFSILSTSYGAGDGSTTFNLPDLRGRVVAGFDNGNVTGRLNSGGVNAAVLGSAGGEQSHVLSVAETAAHNHNVFLTDPSHTHGTDAQKTINNIINGASNTFTPVLGAAIIAPAFTGMKLGSSPGSNDQTTTLNGGNAAHNNVQPSIILNKIIRVSFDG